jgi:hypothetical protein
MHSIIKSVALIVCLATVSAMSAETFEPHAEFDAQATVVPKMNAPSKNSKTVEDVSKFKRSDRPWFRLHFRAPQAGEWPRVGHRGP